jgi:hypothetical protein
MISAICIGLTALIGIMLLTNKEENSRRPVSNEENEKERNEELTRS